MANSTDATTVAHQSTEEVQYQCCERCVLDTSVTGIVFNEAGYCHYCEGVARQIASGALSMDMQAQRLQQLCDEMKQRNSHSEFDCLIGLSGGVDSSYLAYVLKTEYGMRPLALHVDAGWNSAIAVRNIYNVVQNLDIPLITVILQWPEVRDLQRSFLRSGLANQDVVQDHSFVVALHRAAKQYGLVDFASGGNWSTESILPSVWGYDNTDSVLIKDVHRRFGDQKLHSFELLTRYERLVERKLKPKVRECRPLNLLPFIRDDAIEVLEQKTSWQNYGEKHHESRFTKWFQSHYLPVKFGFDKRRAHFSSMIMSGQMLREDALEDLTKSLYNSEELNSDIRYLCNKLEFDREEYEHIMQSPISTFQDYKNSSWMRNYIEMYKRLDKRFTLKTN